MAGCRHGQLSAPTKISSLMKVPHYPPRYHPGIHPRSYVAEMYLKRTSKPRGPLPRRQHGTGVPYRVVIQRVLDALEGLEGLPNVRLGCSFSNNKPLRKATQRMRRAPQVIVRRDASYSSPKHDVEHHHLIHRARLRPILTVLRIPRKDPLVTEADTWGVKNIK